MKRFLIAGATGYLGQYVLKEAINQDYWIRALIRKTSNISFLTNTIDDIVKGEVTNPSTLSGICDGIDVVFSAIGITKQKDGLTYMDVDYQGNMNLLQEAKKAGVKKFIYVSVFNTHKMQHIKAVQAKLKFEKALKESGMDYTIIYPNGFFSDMQDYLHMAKKGRGFVFGSGNNKINPIHGADLAKVCVDAVKSKEKEISVGGPEILTHNEILEFAFQVVNKNVKISKIPMWFRNTMLALMRVLTPAKTFGPVEFFMTVLASDTIAPVYGQHKLKDFFIECKNVN